MSNVAVRRISAAERDLYDELMRVTGGHVREDYHTRLAEWREQGAVLELNYFGEFGASSPASVHDGPVFTVFRHKEATAVYRDAETFSSAAVRNSAGKPFGRTIITEDPPEHRAIRHLTQPLFSRSAVEPWREQYFEPAFRRHLDAIYDRGEADLFHDLLLPYPVAVIHDLMGIETEGERADRFHRLALQIFLVRGPNPQQGLAALEELFDFFSEVIVERRKAIRDGVAGDDLATQLVRLNDDQRAVDDDELARFLRLLLPGGADTTTNTSGNMIVSLLRNPDQLESLRADPSLIDNVVEETMRYEVTSSANYRGATKDVEIGGVTIPEGAMVMCSIASANRDERRFEKPDEFDIMRKPSNHVGFGHGIHLCLGQFMARAEMSVALRVLLETMPRLRSDPDYEPPYVCGVLHRHPGQLRVRWD
jgi:cytochrome P450